MYLSGKQESIRRGADRADVYECFSRRQALWTGDLQWDMSSSPPRLAGAAGNTHKRQQQIKEQTPRVRVETRTPHARCMFAWVDLLFDDL